MQNTFGFFKDIPENRKPSLEQDPEFQRLKKRTPNIIKKMIEDCRGKKEVITTLKMYGLKHQVEYDKIIAVIDGKKYEIEELDYPKLHQVT